MYSLFHFLLFSVLFSFLSLTNYNYLSCFRDSTFLIFKNLEPFFFSGSPKSNKKGKKDRSPSPSASKKGTKSRSPSPPSSKKGSRSGSKSPSPSRKGSRPGSKGSRPGSKRAKSPSMFYEKFSKMFANVTSYISLRMSGHHKGPLFFLFFSFFPFFFHSRSIFHQDELSG